MARPAKFTYTTKSGVRKLGEGYRRIQCFVPGELVKQLKIIGAEKELPFSDVVGEALVAYVKKHRGNK